LNTLHFRGIQWNKDSTDIVCKGKSYKANLNLLRSNTEEKFNDFERMIQTEEDDINDINDINDKNINDKNIINENIINENKKKKVNFNLDEIIPEIKTTIYQEQKSIELPKDNINYTPIDNSRNVTPTQFLPMGEFVKKINDLNLKIDNLTKIVEQLSNLIKNKEG
jgi:hypothetical protein